MVPTFRPAFPIRRFPRYKFFPANVLLLACIFSIFPSVNDFSEAGVATKARDRLPRMTVDDSRAADAGIRKIPGKHIVIYTDLPPSEAVDGLADVFDQAVPQWADYFGVEIQDCAGWKMSGFLMKDKTRFQKAGLLPADLPAFPYGYSRNHEFWLYEQPNDYYRRHLILHEGTHGFMENLLGGNPPPWYAEGVADLLATYRWENGHLTLNTMPGSREEASGWDRIKLLKEAVAENKVKTLKEVIGFSSTAHREKSAYAWTWAAVFFLDGHPRYQKRFRYLSNRLASNDVTAEFNRLFKTDWPQLCEEWELLIHNIEYGYDIARTTIDFTPGKPMQGQKAAVEVATDRGWQNSGIRLESAVKYQFTASGRYQVANQPKIWWSEPNGVSIRYYQGRPLGLLLAAIRPDQGNGDESTPLLQPIEIGQDAAVTPQWSGTLYLKINDSAAELGDNTGKIQVVVEKPG